MFNVLQKSACMPSSASVGRTDTMDYCLLQAAMYSSMAVKSGGPCTLGPHTAIKWEGQDPRTPTGSRPLALDTVRIANAD